MSSEQQSCLRFSVEESVWFQKGQEVRELLSISLDPDIQIIEQDQYVSIKGALYLTGEYRPEGETDNEEVESFAQHRYVEGVLQREDGTFEMEHRFPVDITIPRNRIQNLEDIYVAIDTFDYTTPTRGCLQLEAEISISGINGQPQQSVPAVEEREEVHHVHHDGQEEEEYDPFKYYLEDREEEDLEEEEILNEDTNYHSFNNEEERPEEQEEVVEAVVEETDEEDDVYEPFHVEVRKDPTLEKEEEVEVEREEDEVEDVEEPSYSEDIVQEPSVAFQSSRKEETEKPGNIVSFFSKKEERAEEKPVAKLEAKEEEVDEEKERDENNLSLTKIFADEEGGDFTRLKICIVQHNDTIETIAERYDITAQQLTRMNGLASDDDVHEGQLLYVPAASYSNS